MTLSCFCDELAQTKTSKKAFLKQRRYDKEIKKQAIKLYVEGNSGRAVGRDIRNRKKYVPILDREICEGNRIRKCSK